MIYQREQGLCRIPYVRPDQPVCQLYPFPGTYIRIQRGNQQAAQLRFQNMLQEFQRMIADFRIL